MAGALLLVTGVTGATMPTFRSRGPLWFLPTDVLLLFHPAPGDEYRWDGAMREHVPHPVVAELERRIARGELKPRHWQSLGRTPGLLHVRPKWPVNEPLVVGITLPHWVGSQMESGVSGVGRGEVKVRLSMTGLEDSGMTFAENNESFGPRSHRIHDFGVVYHTESLVSLHMAVYAEAFDDVTDEIVVFPLWRGDLESVVELVETVGQAIDPCEDTELNRLVAEQLAAEVSFREFKSGESRASIWLHLGEATTSRLSDVAVGATVQVWRDDAMITSYRAVLLPSDLDLQGASARRHYQHDLPELAGFLAGDPSEAEIARWSVRVQSDATAALGDLMRSRHWVGEMQLSLKEILSRK